MDLFSSQADDAGKPVNLLPADGSVYYYGPVMPRPEADSYFGRLLHTIAWKHDEANFFGKHILTKRKVAWYGDQAYLYTYSNTTKEALPWTPELLALKALAEKITGHTYNSCLLNLYHSGQEGMAWHSDDEKTLGPRPAIASFSFGAGRLFAFKHKKNGQRISVLLEQGSLLLMQDATQAHWQHRLPPTKKVSQARINLTFRTIFN
ncbi:MAG: alpha-ketoglutarate-dependent dioxygenase AlkB family protein [Adhaeribacter sp.]